MSERTALGATMETMTLEEPGGEQDSPRAPGPLRCGPCAVWPRQQTWLCVVPLLMGFVGLGLSLMLLKWIVVGSVQDYVPTDLVNAKGIGQDPIFLSKPSILPKGPDAPATSTAAPASTVGPGSADGTSVVQRTQSGSPSNHTAGGGAGGARGAGAVGGASGNRAPHLHNRVSTRANGTASTTARTAWPATPGPKEVTPRSTTARKPPHRPEKDGPPSTTSAAASTTAASTTTAAATASTRAPPTGGTPTSPSRPTQRLNHGRTSKGSATKPTRPHHRFRTLAPTAPTVRSEFFKPCQDSQELAFCLNEGECFIIETVAGVHIHCRCKEGYRGLRCDQFVPKTDSILSDPTDELGIEFMESGEIYQRQIMSIFSIAMGISLLGVACMTLYCKNKRQREKHRAQLTDLRSLRDCSPSATRLTSKFRTERGLRHQKVTPPRHRAYLSENQHTPRSAVCTEKHITPALQGSRDILSSTSISHMLKCCRIHGSSPTAGSRTVPSNPKVPAPEQISSLSTGKRRRSCSLSTSPAVKQKITNHRSAPRWTPPISRAGHHLIGGSRDSVHSYKHLQEKDSTDVMSESSRRFQPQTDGTQYNHSYLNMITVASAYSRGRLMYTDVPCTRLDQGMAFLPPSHRTCSVPIIPSVQSSDMGDGSEDQGSTALLYKGGASASHILIRRETEAESLVNSSQSLASPGVAQGPHTVTCSESAMRAEAKHKSLVTYTTALRPGTESSRAKTVISTTVLGPGEQSVQSSNLSRSTGKLERRHLRPTLGGIVRVDQGAPLQTPYIKGEKGHMSVEPRGVSCLTPPKS